jgi:tripartite-type tricarboxylate transporter receptor subunit TctC
MAAAAALAWLPNVQAQAWFGYHYPIAVPREIVQRMNMEMRRVMEHPDYRVKIMDRIGVTPNLGTPEEFDSIIRSQLKQVAELVAYIGIKPE